MAMTKGSVSIDGSGAVSGNGLARELFDDYIAKIDGIQDGAAGAGAKQQIADLCNSLSSVFVDHIVTNAQVTVVITTDDSALQRAGGVDTQEPSANRTLSQKGTVE